METIRVQTVVGPDGKAHIDLSCGLPPGPAEAVVVIAPMREAARELRWSDFYGVGKEIWQGEDAQEYVSRLRDEWER